MGLCRDRHIFIFQGGCVQNTHGTEAAEAVLADDTSVYPESSSASSALDEMGVSASFADNNGLQDKNNELQGKSNAIQSVLIVDPDPDFSSVVCDYLKLFGYRINFRTSIDHALGYAEVNSVDVVLLGDGFDSQHPIDVLYRFKKELPSALTVILANNGDDQLAVELLKAGANDYISRRVKDKDILTAIANLLDKLASEISLDSQHQSISPQLIQSQRESDLNTQQILRGVAASAHLNKACPERNRTTQSVETARAEKLSSVIELLPTALIILNKSLEIVSVNRKCIQLLGYSQPSLLNRSIQEVLLDRFYLDLVAEIERVDSQTKLTNRDKEMPFVENNGFEMLMSNHEKVNVLVRCQVNNIDSPELLAEGDDNSMTSSAEAYILTFEDISQQKQRQADILYRNMWSQLLNSFAQRFINLKLENFSEIMSQMISESAIFFRVDRLSIYLIDKKRLRAKIYLEWLKGKVDSLKIRSKKIDVDPTLFEIENLLNAKIQIIQSKLNTQNLSLPQCRGLSEHYAQVGASSSAIIPIAKKQKVIGWISLDYQKTESVWRENELDLLVPFGKLISEAFIKRAHEAQRKITHKKLSENHGHLSEQAFLDGLTNLANRRYFDKVLESEVRRASRDKTNIAILFCDVDYFKAYNDTYGHLDGDRCLKAIADVLQNEFQRAGDFVARFGGEEFAVILSGMLTGDVQDAAEKLRQKVLAMNIAHHGSPIGKIAISIGISSSISPTPNDSNKLLVHADKALYKAKSNGKNRTETARLIPG